MPTTTNELSVVTPADWVSGPPQGSWTYEDYAALPDDGNRYEIVNGVLIMTPAPSPEHQDIVGEIFSALRTHIKLAGLDRVAEKKIIGAPDLVVEVASPSTAAYDRLTKYEKYAHAGIREYWLVKPTSRSVEVLVLEGREYRSLGIFRGEQTLPSRIVPDLPVGVERFFA
ncbi:MAG: Uma2 family endonuclease [Chloroflexi bacterium]|nr:MAG: Uma2 family endonuclease [Chloroflexota bacterium]